MKRWIDYCGLLVLAFLAIFSLFELDVRQAPLLLVGALPFFRKIGQIMPGASNAPAGTQYRMELPRTALHQRIHLHFYGTWTAGTAGTALTEQPHRAVRLIEVIANGSNVVKQLTAAALYRCNQFDHGVTPVSPTGAIVFTAAEDIHFELTLDFAMPRAIRPIDTVLDARKFSLLELVVTIGDMNDLFSSVTAGAAALALKCDVYVEESVGTEGNFGIYREVEMLKSFSSISGDQEIQLPTGDFYRAITLRLLNSSNNPVDLLAGTAGHEVSLRSGATEFIRRLGWGNAAVAASSDSAFSGLLGQNQMQYGITVPDGYRRLDFAKDGLLTEALDSGQLEELVLTFGLGTSSASGELRHIDHTIVNPQFVRA